MALHTLTSLILLARQSADMESDPLCDDTEITGYLNDARGKFMRAYFKVFNDAYLKSTPITIASGATTAPLPADFFQPRGLGIIRSGREYPLGTFSFRNRGSNDSGRRSYRVDSLIRLDPIHLDQSGTYTFWYHASPVQFVVGGDTLDVIEDNYFSFHVDYAAWRMLVKAKLDSTEQQKGMAAVIGEMQTDGANRIGEPAQAPDAEAGYDDWGY